MVFWGSPLRTVTMLAAVVLMAACTSKFPGDDTERKPMLELYQEHIASAPTLNRELRHGDADLAAYTRTADNELEVLFPLLPNPKIVLYVFPHIAEGVPVPGYATSFNLYEKDHYALPAEYPR
ncbi:MAG: TIGR03751 family conjugal transfer lipoprotein [Chromatiales bacterium]|nr:TIGR03751 family conjugal transfer lipoprotein [Chromatiales bacterium]